MGRSLSIYVHIPFCVRKCNYCDFLSFYAKKDVVEAYFAALKKEIALAADELCTSSNDGGGAESENDVCLVKSMYFGGGTPSIVDAQLICDTLAAIKSSFAVADDAEISIEVNPASAMYDKLLAYREEGFNRISIGAQSLDDEELKCLGRAHDSAMFYETFENARKAGFTNINVDVMSALPGQSLESYLATLGQVVALKPEHISAYSLILEEGTPFYDMELDLPDEDTDRAMYHETKRLLAKAGYHRYEISNYALGAPTDRQGYEGDNAGQRGFECYHNKVYWQRGDYLGLGIGAASMIDNVRWSNTRDIAEYIDVLGSVDIAASVDEAFRVNSSACVDDSADVPKDIDGLEVRGTLASIRRDYEELPVDARMEEFMFLGLRLVEGVSTIEFERLFGKEIREVYGEVIDKYLAMGLLEYLKAPVKENANAARADLRLRLTDKGLDVSNTVMAEFLL